MPSKRNSGIVTGFASRKTEELVKLIHNLSSREILKGALNGLTRDQLLLILSNGEQFWGKGSWIDFTATEFGGTEKDKREGKKEKDLRDANSEVFLARIEFISK